MSVEEAAKPEGSLPTVPQKGKHSASRKKPRGKWQFPKVAVASMVVVLIGIGIFLYPQTAAWLDQKRQAYIIGLGLEALAGETYNDDDLAEQLDLAHQYNDALKSGVYLGANENMPTGVGTGSETFD